MDKNQIISLVRQAQNGDNSAFEELYREFGRAVYFNCLKLTGNEQEAQDILQDTFMTAYQKISALQFPENFSAWIIRIAINNCKMSFRNPVLQTDDPEQALESLEDDGLIPDDYVDNDEKRRIIMNIIDQVLTAEQRQTIILYYFDSMSVAEISRIMECPVGSVTSRLSAARQKIREAVLIYEKENNDKLHAVVPVPVLTRILNKEAEKLALPRLAVFSSPNADAANTNSDTCSGNSVQNTEPGGKSMFKSLKSKIIAGAAAVAIVGGGVTGAVLMTRGDEEIDTNEETVVSSEVYEGGETADSSEADVTEHDGVKFWITSQNFTSAPLTELPEDFTVLDTQISMPLTYEKLDEYYQSYDKSTDERYGLSYQEVFEQTSIKGHSPGHSADEYKDYLFAKGMTDGVLNDERGATWGNLIVRNYSGEDKTADECFANNWWCFGYTSPNGGSAYRFMGLSKDELGSDADKEGLDRLVEQLGTPTYFSPMLTDKTPQQIEKEQFTEDLVLLTYRLAWEYDEYVVSVTVTEIINRGKLSVSFDSMSVQPTESWVKGYENNKEVNDSDGRTIYFEYDNKIDLITDSGM